MLTNSPAFSGFSVDSLENAKKFYGETLGLKIEETPEGLKLHTGGGTTIFIYEKEDHTPATYTIMNFPVEDIDHAVQDLKDQGITFENYEGMTDEDGIARGLKIGMGPDIAWFKDPAGNFLSVLKDK